MLNLDPISIKSKVGVEFGRYNLRSEDVLSFDSFYKQIEKFHSLSAIPFVIFYISTENYLIPIKNNDNLSKAIGLTKYNTLCDHNYNHISRINNGINKYEQYLYNYDMQQTPHVNLKRPLLKLLIEVRGRCPDYYTGNSSGKYKKNQPFKCISNLVLSSQDQNHQRPSIGMPADFRQVSSIIDVGIVPKTCRRVRIVKHGSDRPLGFYIRDGTYKRMNSYGQLELVTGIFISRLVPGGLAESTGLLAVNDEVLEVNGVSVSEGKTLDEAMDMMVANSSNLIITIRPSRTNQLT